MNRIDSKNKQLSTAKKKAFVAYVTAGLPDLEATEKIVYVLEECGVDFIELGMPFSDPIADGPTIQQASTQALANGITLEKYFGMVRRLRKKTQIPLLIMTYYNIVLNFGVKEFAREAFLSGLDGVVIPDLPPEESVTLNKALTRLGIHQIFLVSPVTEDARAEKIARLTRGFIYYVTLTGVTGARSELPADVFAKIKKIKKYARIPVFAGFGISRPEQLKNILRSADGVIVGSAIVKIILENKNTAEILKKIRFYLRSMKKQM